MKFNLLKLISGLLTLSIIMLSTIMIIAEIYNEYNSFTNATKKMQAEYMNQQKELVKQDVKRVIRTIEYEHNLTEKRLKRSINNNVTRAFETIRFLWKKYHKIKTKKQITELIKDSLRPVHFWQGRGYYFILSLDGTEVLNSAYPELEGKNLSNSKDAEIRNSIRETIRYYKEGNSDRYLKGKWAKPTVKDTSKYEEISYTKLFKPYGWLIGTAEYLDEVKHQIQNDLLNQLANYRFGHEGYIFINHYDGRALLSNGQRIQTEKKLWESSGVGSKSVFDKELKAVTNKEGGFIYYKWKKLSSDSIVPKISFVYGLPEWQWIVGAGVYIDDLEKNTQILHNKLRLKFKNDLIRNIVILLLTLSVLLTIWFLLVRRIKTELSLFLSFFNQAAHSNQMISLDNIRFKEFYSLAKNANIMLQKKLVAEQEMLKIKKLESVGTLAGGIAHDFNNLLTGIFGNISLAKLQLKPENKIYRYMESAENAIERATGLTKQLLTFAKGGDPVKEDVDIETLVRDTAEFNLRGSNIKLDFQPTPFFWTTKADKGQFSQVIANLVINAKQAMTDGGTLQIRITNWDKKQNWIKIIIKDEGAGIPDEYINKIFDPYFTTKEEGTGLGLATVYSIVQKHGGKIEVESEINTGATFTIYLPAIKTDTHKPLSQVTATGKTNHPLFKGRVLLMDDTEMIRDTGNQMLQAIGLDVTLCEEGYCAIEQYRKALETDKTFDLVILDLTVPGGMGGRRTAEKILALDPHAKIVVSSGYSTDPIMANFKEYGFLGVIVKPYRMEELYKILQQISSL